MKRHIIFYSLLLLALLCPAALMAGNYVIINQVMYDTPLAEEAGIQGCFDGEFFELYNGGTESVSLSGWSIHSLSGKSTREVYFFPDITIYAKGYLIFSSRYEEGDNFEMEEFYPLENKSHPRIYYYSDLILSNKKETLLLINDKKDTVDQIVFGSQTNLKAANAQGTWGSNCKSLHRSGVELDDAGKVIFAKSQWKTDKVSFGVCQLPNPTFGTRTIFSYNPSAGSAASNNGCNYILSVSPLDETNKIQASNNGISVDADIRTQATIQYYDGLGRPNELIAIGATPNKKDLVSTITYSGLHRATQQWLPVEIDSKGQYVDFSSYKDVVNSYYNDARPFTETLYENSALERVTGQKRPGESYVENPSTNVYETNTETDVRVYTVNGNKLKANGTYAAHTLYKTTSADEDGVAVTTFTDKLGNKIMEDRSGSRVYYVYDDLNRLRFVLPHIADKLVAGDFSLDNPVLSKAAYCYKYDDRGNMIYKRLPGCEPQYMVYDMIGQLVLKQDGNQRKKSKWTQCAYDSIGRNLYTCEIYTAQDEYDLKKLYENKWAVEHFDGKSLYTMALNTGYANTILDVVGRMYTINYYDNYDYLDMKKLSGAKDGLQYDGNQSDYGKKTNNTIGLLTGTRVYNLSEPGFTVTAYYYDAQGRVIQSRSMRGSADTGFKPDKTVYTKYNFNGTIAQQLTKQGDVTEQYRYTYDHAGRSKKVVYQLNDEPEITLSEFSYDEQGRLVRNLLYKKVGDKNYSDTITYSYDMRNMLIETKNKHFTEQLFYADNIPQYGIQCHNGNIAASRVSYIDDGYTFYHKYDKHNRLISSCIDPKHGVRYSIGETFSYDAAGNIRYLQRNNGKGILDDLELDYGEGGNQLLSVKDDGNDADGSNEVEYKDFNDEGQDMRYDANGNLIRDLDRGIDYIVYNILNLPDSIFFHNGNVITNSYDAAGLKLESTVYNVPQTLTTTSADVLRYAFPANKDDYSYHRTAYNGNVEHHTIIRMSDDPDLPATLNNYSIVHNAIGYSREQGRSSLGYSRDYDTHFYHYIKDHLGNNCVVVESATNTPVQQTMYYASGVPMPQSTNRDEQPYLYNGKEFIEAHGFDTYDYGFRGYYATIGRFTSMDPLCEKYYHISPYAYCANNPVNAIDPDGRDWYQNSETNYYTWFSGNGQRENYTYVGPKGCLFGELESTVDKTLTKLKLGGLFTNGRTIDITPLDKGALLPSRERVSDFSREGDLDFSKERDLGFFSEFKHNKGPEFSILLSDHPYTQRMMNDDIVGVGQSEVEKKGTLTIKTRNWTFWSVLNPNNWNITQQFIGSYTYFGEPSRDGMNINNVIYDSKSKRSYFYHIIPESMNKRRNECRKYGNTYQLYIWQSPK